MSGSNDGIVHGDALLLVNRSTFLGVVWTCVAVTLILVILRLVVRIRVYRKLFDDDALVCLAWLILFTCTVLWHVKQTLSLIYESYLIGSRVAFPSASYLSHFNNWLHMLFAETLLHLFGLWSIKYSFLAFFWRLVRNVKGQKWAWWTVFILTTAGLAISIGVNYFPCIFATAEKELTYCTTPEAGRAIRRSYRIQVGCDVSTDALIMMVPLRLLWGLQMSLRQKLGLIGIFSLTLITIVFAIIRVEVALRGVREDDSWFYLGTSIELTVAIAIACIVSYRSFFTERAQSRVSKHSSDPTYLGKSNGHRYYVEAGTDNNNNRTRRYEQKISDSSLRDRVETEVMPLDMINVKEEVDIRWHSSDSKERVQDFHV